METSHPSPEESGVYDIFTGYYARKICSCEDCKLKYTQIITSMQGSNENLESMISL